MNKKPKVFCIGLGKLGLMFSQILAEKLGSVIGYDINKNIINSINLNAKSLEPNLNYLIKKNKKKFFIAETIKDGVEKTNSAFLVLPTPSKKNFEFDNKYILNCLLEIGPNLIKKKNYVINITSTVNPGSCEMFANFLENKFKIKSGKNFIITYNPHLIALGSIYDNIMHNDLVLIGSNESFGFQFLKKIYKKIYNNNIKKLKLLNLKEAEISKIAINTFVTMKISFTNSISQISDRYKNINTKKILNTIGEDKRIGKKYLSLGALYSGPCFPRDNLNFSKFLDKNKLNNSLAVAIDTINNIQLKRYIQIFKNNNKLNKPTIGICGMSYKDNTNLSERSPGKLLYNYFKNKYKTFIHDQNYPDFKVNCFIKNINNFVKKCDVIFICYKNKKFMAIGKQHVKKNKLIIDLWNCVQSKNKKFIIKNVGIS